MSVHEMVSQTMDYVKDTFVTGSSNNAHTLDLFYGQLLGDSEPQEPPEGRVSSIREKIDSYTVTLVHPNKAVAHDLHVGLQEPVAGLCFQDPDGLEVSPIDLCIRIWQRADLKNSVYVASRGNLYTLQTVGLETVLARHKRQEKVETVDVSEVGEIEALAVAFYAIRAAMRLPPSVRGIKRERWMMQEAMDQGIADPELRGAERMLLDLYQARVSSAPKPPETHPYFPGARSIGYGWEWAVYLLPDGKTVAKVPRGIFPEIAEPRYLYATMDAYDACMACLPQFTAMTSFEHTNDMNILRQDYLTGTPIKNMNPAKLTTEQRHNFQAFGAGLMTILNRHDWFPDLWLQRTDSGLWQMRNVILVGDNPILYDFSAIYDDFRLSPKRTREESAKMRALLHRLKNDMS